MLDFVTYAGLFFTALVAATLLPAQSELVLATLVHAGRQPTWMLLVVACAGNVLGSTINWLLGRYIERYRDSRWFPIKPAMLEKVTGWYHRFGRWSLLLSWMPLIGDPLTVVAGVLREPLWSFLAIVTVAKLARYIAIAAMTQGW